MKINILFNELTTEEFTSLEKKLVEKLNQIKSLEYDLEQNNCYDSYIFQIKHAFLKYFEDYFGVLYNTIFKTDDEQLSSIDFIDIKSSIESELDSLKNTIIELYKKRMSLVHRESLVANKIQKEDFEHELKNFQRELDDKEKCFQINLNKEVSVHKKHVDEKVFLKKLSVDCAKATISSAKSSRVSAIAACVSVIVSLAVIIISFHK